MMKNSALYTHNIICTPFADRTTPECRSIHPLGRNKKNTIFRAICHMHELTGVTRVLRENTPIKY